MWNEPIFSPALSEVAKTASLPFPMQRARVAQRFAMLIHQEGGGAVEQGYRLIVVDKDGVLVSEFQLTENDLAQPEAFVASIKQTIDDIEEEEP
jgi:hypothetical protein